MKNYFGTQFAYYIQNSEANVSELHLKTLARNLHQHLQTQTKFKKGEKNDLLNDTQTDAKPVQPP